MLILLPIPFLPLFLLPISWFYDGFGVLLGDVIAEGKRAQKGTLSMLVRSVKYDFESHVHAVCLDWKLKCEFLYLGKPTLQLQNIFVVFSLAGRNSLQFYGKGVSETKMNSSIACPPNLRLWFLISPSDMLWITGELSWSEGFKSTDKPALIFFSSSCFCCPFLSSFSAWSSTMSTSDTQIYDFLNT